MAAVTELQTITENRKVFIVERIPIAYLREPAAIAKAYENNSHIDAGLPTFSLITMANHPLLTPMVQVDEHITRYRGHARNYFHEVVLLPFVCPECEGRLAMTGPSRAECSACAHELDPSITFQKSPCCGSRLRLARQHYVCTSCHTAVPSRFLFVERVFDAKYFRERMAESRERMRRKREELRRLLAWEHSGRWRLETLPEPIALSGLFSQLDTLAGKAAESTHGSIDTEVFSLEQYRTAIAVRLAKGVLPFDALPVLHTNPRLDRTRRFITLIYMEQSREVLLHQHHDKIMVIPHAPDHER
jgi:hypothetical protein